MPAYSADLRLRIHEARQNGDSTLEVAERFSVSTAFVRRLEQRFRETGSLAPRKPERKGPLLLLAPHEKALRQAVAETPDLTAAEYKERLELPGSVRTVARFIRRLGLRIKKNESGRRAGTRGREGEA